MEYIKDLKNIYIKRNHVIGRVSFPDGLVDVTDPCYSRDTWCALYDVKVLPGNYTALIDEVDFQSVWHYDEDDVRYGYAEKVGKGTMHDPRIVTLTIVHEDYLTNYLQRDYHERTLAKNIGVDAGLCGFYNHKPDFKEDDAWEFFWKSLKCLDGRRYYTADCRDIGVTVSSGFGDGCYICKKFTKDRKTIGLQLLFV